MENKTYTCIIQTTLNSNEKKEITININAISLKDAIDEANSKMDLLEDTLLIISLNDVVLYDSKNLEP